jgi:hypothetical protein
MQKTYASKRRLLKIFCLKRKVCLKHCSKEIFFLISLFLEETGSQERISSRRKFLVLISS